jgi:regulator of sigma E protease
MLPLPALDGGRIIFVIYTMITGKKVSQKVEGTIHLIGMALLFALMIYVTFNDVTRIFGR